MKRPGKIPEGKRNYSLEWLRSGRGKSMAEARTQRAFNSSYGVEGNGMVLSMGVTNHEFPWLQRERLEGGYR